MHGSFDQSPQDDQRIYRSWTIKLIALPVLALVALIAFAISHPRLQTGSLKPSKPNLPAPIWCRI